MSTGTQPVARSAGNGATAELSEWRNHARVFLQPIAAPSILGLFGFACATFMVTAHLVGWYGNAASRCSASSTWSVAAAGRRPGAT